MLIDQCLKKMAIGTVQFGLNYGISNKSGQTSLQEVSSILELAAENSILTLDTAKLYGESEAVIGNVLTSKNFDVVTKTSKFGSSNNAEKYLKKDFVNSTSHLKQKPYGLLFHDQSDLLLSDAEKIFEQATKLKSEDMVKKIGVSVYDPEAAKIIINTFDIDIIQLPLNIYDQRFINTGLLDDIKANGIEVHTRSAFLQGLLLMKELPKYFKPIISHHEKFLQHCTHQKKSPLEMALEFTFSNENVDKVVLGINQRSQLEEIISAFKRLNTNDLDHKFLSSLAISDHKIINPGNWKNA